MARKNYRYTSANLGKLVTSGGVQCFEIKPLEDEQSPSGRLQKVKVSVIPSPGAAGTPRDSSFLISASTNSSFSNIDIITAQAVPNGGGTVWLNVPRTIRDSSSDSSRNDGMVSIWVRSSTSTNEVDLVAECWGRFLEVENA